MRKIQAGIIVSDKMQETAVVEVAVWKMNRILKKRYQTHRKFMVHNPENKYKTGETVELAETRPLSRHKHWEITKKIDVHTTTEPKKGKK